MDFEIPSPEFPLRAIVTPEREEEDFTLSPALFCEIVSSEGKEIIRGFNADTGEMFYYGECRLRSSTIIKWERLTGERVGAGLRPVGGAA